MIDVSTIRPAVIGFAGPQNVGKDTTCRALISEMNRRGHTAVTRAFAAPLYEMISAATGITVDLLQDREFKEKPFDYITAPSPGLVGRTPRSLLQEAGTEWVRTYWGASHWVMQLARWRNTYHPGSWLFASDVRFATECSECDLVVELTRDGVEYNGAHSSAQRLPADVIDMTYYLEPRMGYTLMLDAIIEALEYKRARLGKDSIHG